MLTEKKLRLLLFIVAAGLHVLLILFLAFNVAAAPNEAPETARVMKVMDLAEEIPPPPPPPPPPAPPPPSNLPLVESIAETMIETETPPEQTVVAPATLITPVPVSPADEYLPMHKVSVRPEFDEQKLAKAIVYPSMALRSGIEGRVILELFVDRNGMVRQIRILQESPQGWGFGEAAVKAFTGYQASPARANGEPVSCRMRWPVTFRSPNR
jgi:protein TonB